MPWKICLAKITQYFCIGWMLLFLIGGLWATKGDFLSSGGGTTLLGLFPPAIFCLGLYYLEKKQSGLRFPSALLFWFGLIAINLGYYFWVRGMEHWPYGVAALYVVFTLLGLLQALGFSGWVFIKSKRS